MVNEVEKRGLMVYVCELCGSTYRDLETAERCERYCYSHGHSSRDITQRVVKPFVRVSFPHPRSNQGSILPSTIFASVIVGRTPRVR
jgi:hypothetical protein